MFRTAAFCAALTLLPIQAIASDLTVSLKFDPQEGVQSEAPSIAPSMLERPYVLRVEDGRGKADPRTIGKGTDDDDETFAILAGSDVVTFVKETLTKLSDDWGLQRADSADRVLVVKLTRYYVDESNKAVGSVYASEVRLAWTLLDGTGAHVAEGSGSGSAHRYGRARSADNCNEVLSDALKEAFSSALSSASSSSSSSSSSGTDKGSVEERLRKLDELLQKGLITKEEYDRKRAEILKDV
jgi:hypothetical protein